MVKPTGASPSATQPVIAAEGDCPVLSLSLIHIWVEAQREINQAVVQQREADREIGQPVGSDNLGQIVVGQSVLPVVPEHAVDQCATVSRCIGFPLLPQRVVRVCLLYTSRCV